MRHSHFPYKDRERRSNVDKTVALLASVVSPAKDKRRVYLVSTTRVPFKYRVWYASQETDLEIHHSVVRFWETLGLVSLEKTTRKWKPGHFSVLRLELSLAGGHELDRYQEHTKDMETDL